MQDTAVQEFLTDLQRWQALVKRNSQADGVFLYGVKTTGIYCRPGCPSRLPNQQNVVFFQTDEEAEQAGFRPCKRCQPNTISPRCQQVESIASICKRIETSEKPLSLEVLATEAGLSQYHFHRLFKTIVGVTPKQYAVAQRAQRIRNQLNSTTSITQVIYDAGFGASSRFYEGATEMLGMTPTEYKQGAIGINIRFALKLCSLGWLLVAATERGICTIEFGDTPDALVNQLKKRFTNAKFDSSDLTLTNWVEQVVALVETPRSRFNLPLDIQGTAFQQRVWSTLQAIPPGSTASYADVAEQLGNPKAVRAVARACAANQIAVAIPCHRVVGSDGSLKGYRWGSDRKQALLRKEAEYKSQKEDFGNELDF